MEAKDKRVIQLEILQSYPGTIPDMDIDWDMMEISFKAGIVQGKKEQYIVDWEHEGEAVKQAKQDGIREVVSDIVKLMDCRLKAETFAIKVSDYCEAQIKNGGYDE